MAWIDSAARRSTRSRWFWQAIEKASQSTLQGRIASPFEAVRCEQFQAAKLNDIIGK